MNTVIEKESNITVISFKEKTTQQINRLFQLKRTKKLSLVEKWL